MKWAALLVFLNLSPLVAEDIFLTCQITEIAAKEGEGKVDGKLKKIHKFLEKDEAFKKYKSFKLVSRKSLNTTKDKSGSAKLKNKSKLSVTAVSVNRAQRKNTVTIDVSVGDRSSDRKSFIDREYLILNAGELDKKTDLILAVQCPVFP